MRYIIIDSTKYIGRFSVYDTIEDKETPCHNHATAKSLCKQWNEDHSVCEVYECDPCDCHTITH
jgi:hypothetical protein